MFSFFCCDSPTSEPQPLLKKSVLSDALFWRMGRDCSLTLVFQTVLSDVHLRWRFGSELPTSEPQPLLKKKRPFGRSFLADGERFELPEGRPSTVFKTAALNHSATHPSSLIYRLSSLLSRRKPFPLNFVQ